MNLSIFKTVIFIISPKLKPTSIDKITVLIKSQSYYLVVYVKRCQRHALSLYMFSKRVCIVVLCGY